MYYLLTLLCGIIINIMVAANGSLAGYIGVYSAVVVSYIIAIVVSFIILKTKKMPIKPTQKLPMWAFLGGIVSVFSALCSNFAFGKISMIAITALGLLAQTVTSLIIDVTGMFGFEKRPAKASVWICIAISFVGMIVMMYGADMTATLALVLSFAAGISLVISRMLSASLSRSTSPLASSFLTHLIGLPAAILILLLIAKGEVAGFANLTSVPVLAYTGGILGIFILMLTNITLEKVSALNVTLLIFVGQVFSGVVIDLIMGNSFSSRTFIGGIIVSVGIIAQTLIANKGNKA